MNKELVVYCEPKSRISEAIKGIRVNLQFSSVDEEVKTIMVTSTMPGEGKSFIASNLACAFSATGKNVLIVDCDLRRGRQHKIFETENKQGLSNLLVGNTDDLESYIEQTKYRKISLLSMGKIPPNPSELLSSKRNKKLINLLKNLYDIIIFDCPPANGLPDALVLAGILDTTIIVSSVGLTSMEQLQQAKKSLEKVGAKISGVVMNRVPVDNRNSYYYGYYTQ